jgi:DNA polymerase III subunit gamma/tau
MALYRTYRPGSLAEVIGQEHVTEPLARALSSGRTHHAYLFSGPRGCGKTSTARIIARSLNCEQGPTASPCGACRSCVELAPNGPGSIDVVELDAATHRGIDDARELREKAIYAPAASRFKIYIIDEAHQLTNEAANALLKLVEEPPAHLRFIFATTEPDKIIPTIRSRTFHYGFRLVPARILAEHLASVCESEGVPAEAPALSVVARAGAGSVRDSLSVLGQLLAGAGPEGLTYADAVSALGLTDATLIDSFVAALAHASAAEMFAVVDEVISAGHDPRRFVTDVLDRLRDLIILRADSTALASGLVDVPDDAGERMLAQAEAVSLAELSRAADLVSVGLGEMKGATAPRLQLELLCARLALPTVADDHASLLARLERLERGGSAATAAAARPIRPEVQGGPVVPPPTPPAPAAAPAPAAGTRAAEGSAPLQASEPAIGTGASPPAASGRPPAPPRRPSLRSEATAAPQAAGEAEADVVTRTAPGAPASGAPLGGPDRTATRPAGSGAGTSAPGPSAPSGEAAATPTPAGGADLGAVQGAWTDVLARLAADSRVAWTAFHSATPVSLANGALAVAVSEPGQLRAIAQRGHDERLRQALIDVLGLDVTIDVLHDPGSAGPRAQKDPAAADRVSGNPDQPHGGPSASGETTTTGGSRLVRAASGAQTSREDEPPDEPSADDPDMTGGDGLALIARELGARPIGEIDHS